jgi:hypothetical protein
VAQEARQTRAIFLDGQRLLYYCANYVHYITAERVYGHEQIYEALLAATLLRLHSGLERLLRAQMPMAKVGGATADGDYTVDWRDLIIFLQQGRRLMPADANFLREIARLRNSVVHGEIVAIDPRALIHLSEFGRQLFEQFDPEYRRPQPDPLRDALPTSHPSSAGALSHSAPSPASAGALPRTEAAPAGGMILPPDALPEDLGFLSPAAPGAGTPPAVHQLGEDAPALTLHSAPLPEVGMGAAGAQRTPIAWGETEACPNCGRPVRPGDRWCPRCGQPLPPAIAQAGQAPAALGASAPSHRSIISRITGGRH